MAHISNKDHAGITIRCGHHRTDGFCSERGSVSIEAALILPLVTGLFFVFMSMIQAMCFKAAVSNAALTVAQKISADSVIFYKSGFADLKENVRNKALAALPDDGVAGEISYSLGSVAFSKLESAAWSAVVAPILENEIEKEITKTGLSMDLLNVSLAGSVFYEEGNAFELRVRCSTGYLFPMILRKGKGVETVCCVKGNGWLYGGTTRYTVNDINVWELSNLKRGKVIEEVFGSNLPEFFPVIDLFDSRSGTATVFVSIDITAPYYEKESSLRKTVFSYASKLKNFDGGECDGIRIEPGEVKYRKILLILPDNAADGKYANVLLDLSVECTMKYNVSVESTFYQHSGVYE